MPYKMSDTTDQAQMRAARPFGPGLDAATAERAARMEVWASSFSDHGGDYCEFIFFDAAGREIARRRVSGY